MDQYGRGSYQALYHDICPAGGNRTVYYACSSEASDQGLLDHFVISDPSSPPEDIAMINWQAATGHITEHAKFARTIHAQNQRVVQQQMMMYQAQCMQAQQYYALQHQLMEQQAQAMKEHYHSQLRNSPAFAQGYALSVPQQQQQHQQAKAASKASSRKLTKSNSSQQATAGSASVYSEVSPSVDVWAGHRHPTHKSYSKTPLQYSYYPTAPQAHAPTWNYESYTSGPPGPL
jgi:hypothetical protein